MDTDTIDTTEVGNTKPLRTGRIRSRKWVFTVNNPSDDTEHKISLWVESLRGKLVIGNEVGASGTPHLQGYCEFSNAISFETIKKAIPKGHIEKAIGNRKQNISYCTKENESINTFDDNKKEYELEYEREMELEYKNIEWKPWQKDVIDILNEKPDNRTVHWLWEERGGTGKTFLSKWIDWKYDAIIANGKQADVFHAYSTYLQTKEKQPKVALIDIPRSHKEFVCYSTMEKIKDGLVNSGKYEGGKLRLTKHHLIIFANFYPDITKLSRDRWNIIKID